MTAIKQAIEALKLAIETSYSESNNVMFNAAIAALRSMPAEPYAYAVYFPDQPTEELVHDLDELLDDMTNREHTITELFATPPPAPVLLTDAEIDAITELNHAQWLALENVRHLAARNRNEEWAQHMLRWCTEAGNAARIMRATPSAPTAVEPDERAEFAHDTGYDWDDTSLHVRHVRDEWQAARASKGTP